LKALEVENKIKEERASSKDKGGTCLKCSESDKRVENKTKEESASKASIYSSAD
jgi:hypothetical protein